MATFAKYVAPQVPRTDWGAITRDLSAGLQKVYQEREAEKQALDKLQVDAVAKANEAEMGKSKTANELLMGGINNYKDALAAQNKLLKQGLITPAQYRMNMLKGQESWNAVAKNFATFNQDYADFMDRVDKGLADEQEIFAREQYFSLTDLKDKVMYVNPVDLNVYFASVNPETGEVIEGSLMDAKTINNALNQKVTKVDVFGAAKKYADSFGKFAGIDPATGKYVVSGINENKRKEYLDKGVNSILANDKAIASVLLSTMKDAGNNPMFKAYSKTDYAKLSPEEKRNAVVMEPNAEGVFVPQLTEEQRQAAKDYTTSVIESMIDFKEKDPFDEKYKWASLYSGKSGSDKVVYDFRPDIEAIYADPLSNSGYLRGANTKFGTIENVNVINTDTGPAVSLRFYKGQDQFGMPQYATYSFQGNDFKSIIYDALVARRAGGGRVIPFQQLYPPSGGPAVLPQTTTGRYNANQPASNAPVRGDAMFGARQSASPAGGGLLLDNY